MFLRIADWPFPHGNLPKIWQDVLPHPERPKRKRKVEKVEDEDEDENEDEEMKKLVTSIEAMSSICDPQGGDLASAAAAQMAAESTKEEVGSTKSNDEAPDPDIAVPEPDGEAEKVGLSVNADANDEQDRLSDEDQNESDEGATESEDSEESEEDDEEWCQLCNSNSDAVGGWYVSPQREVLWFQRNKMWQYIADEIKSDAAYTNIEVVREAQRGSRGTIRLEENCRGEQHNCVVSGFIQGQWVFAPKFEWCGKPRLVTQLFAPRYDGDEY